MKTLVTFDFDECVSPIDNSKNFNEIEEFKVLKLAGFPCAIRKPVIEFLNQMALSKKATPVWATSWDESTEYFHEDSQGLIPQIPWLKTNDYLNKRGKAEAIVHYATAHDFSKVVVFEDSRTVLNKIKKLTTESSINFLMICPKKGVGITDKHIKQALDFIG